MTRRLVLAALLLAMMAPAGAHRASDAFLQLAVQDGRLSGTWEIALRDLEAAITLDTNGDRQITWGELKAARPILARRLPPYLAVATAAGPCEVQVSDLQVSQRSDGAYAWLELAGTCPQPAGALGVQYRFLFDLDPTHRAILSLDGGDGVQTAVLSPSLDRFPGAGGADGRLAQFSSFVREGVAHIWSGYDHLLFLLSLLLPCVLVRRDGRWHPAQDARVAGLGVLWVVTAFTLAHSLTLSLAVLDLVRLPAGVVEPLIALTVLLVALNNAWPVVTRHRAAAALALGLIHGFGFASALGDLGLPAMARALGLAGFNLGVELGQLVVVALVMPALFLLRGTRYYQAAILRGGSLVIAALAAAWLAERVLLP